MKKNAFTWQRRRLKSNAIGWSDQFFLLRWKRESKARWRSRFLSGFLIMNHIFQITQTMGSCRTYLANRALLLSRVFSSFVSSGALSLAFRLEVMTRTVTRVYIRADSHPNKLWTLELWCLLLQGCSSSMGVSSFRRLGMGSVLTRMIATHKTVNCRICEHSKSWMIWVRVSARTFYMCV